MEQTTEKLEGFTESIACPNYCGCQIEVYGYKGEDNWPHIRTYKQECTCDVEISTMERGINDYYRATERHQREALNRQYDWAIILKQQIREAKHTAQYVNIHGLRDELSEMLDVLKPYVNELRHELKQ